MKYQAKNFDNLEGVFSDELLKNHLALYQGYVANTNKLAEQAEKRRLGWEFNGMRLHELYFENMKKGGSSLDENSELAKKIKENFGSYENWEKDFKETGLMRGIGWVILYYDPEAKNLFNTWINEHDLGHLAGASPLLVMDVFEHAFITDFGLKRADYIEVFIKSINWQVVAGRFNA